MEDKKLYIFYAGYRAKAEEVNENFQMLLNYCKGLEERLNKLEKLKEV